MAVVLTVKSASRYQGLTVHQVLHQKINLCVFSYSFHLDAKLFVLQLERLSWKSEVLAVAGIEVEAPFWSH